ncbi:MAG: hypothetical protein HRT44_07070, partial [Bdellovibrionales bacterium]|nr:hypothetical protein [Bdellovibrionales bacterium]
QDLTFEQEIKATATGGFVLPIGGSDLAGNTVENQLTLNFDLLLVPALITIEDVDGGETIAVVGHAGASKPNSIITINSGFFNSGTTISDDQGQFVVQMKPFGTAKIKATNSGNEAEADLTYIIKTRIAGMVRNIDDQSLPGVKVRIAGSDKFATTDISGAFSIENPPTGVQSLIFDASVLNTDNIKYSNASVSVNIGYNKESVLEDAIYLAPVVIDGTETLITEQGGGVITHPSVPGVSVTIPSGVKTIFPDGTNRGVASVRKSLSKFATTPVPDFAVPDEIIHLEPSGLRFTEPVELILPNDNELPPGVEFVIFSMDNAKGTWEVDGIAQVDPSGNFVKTKEGMGITHFSPKYAAPIGPVIRKYTDVGERGVNSLDGGLARSIQMPSFKSNGSDISPTLIYNSKWARPSATVTNYFSIPERRVQYTSAVAVTATQDGIFSKPDIKTDYCFTDEESESKKCYEDYFEYWRDHDDLYGLQAVKDTAWYEPSEIKTNFYVGALGLQEQTFDDFFTKDPSELNAKEGKWGDVPNQTLISFGVDLKKQNGEFFESGIYPTLADYEIKLKRITIRSVKYLDIIRENGFGKGNGIRDADTKVRYAEETYEEEQIKEALPSSVSMPVYVQNHVKSSVGRGWKVGGVQRIFNPGSHRILLEEGTGELSQYNADISIETLKTFSAEDKVDFSRGVSLDSWPEVVLPKKEDDGTTRLVKFDLSSKLSTEMPLGQSLENTKSFLKTARLCPVGQQRKGPNEKFVEHKWDFTIPNIVSGLYVAPNGQVFGTNSNQHQLFSGNGGAFSNIAGFLDDLPAPNTYEKNNATSLREWCFRTYGTDCVKDPSPIKVESCPNFTQIRTLQVWFKYTGHGATAQYNNGVNVNIGTGKIPSKTPTLEGFNSPMGIVGGPDGLIYVADTGNNRIVKVDPVSGEIYLVNGSGQAELKRPDGSVDLISVSSPRGLAFDNSGNLYATFKSGHVTVINVNSNTSRMKVVAGAALDDESSELVDIAPATRFSMVSPTGIVVDSENTFLYVADTLKNRIVQVDLAGEVASTIAGNGNDVCGDVGDGGSSLSACISRPTWLGFDDNKNLLVTDTGNKSIRRISLNGNVNSVASYLPKNLDNSTLKKMDDGSYERVRRNGIVDVFNAEGLHTSSKDRVG